jgi:hypothetical protein
VYTILNLPMKNRILAVCLFSLCAGMAPINAAETPDPGPKIEEAQQKALAQLSQRGVLVQPLASGLNWYYVNFRGAEKVDSPLVANLKDATAVVDLDLAGQKLADSDFAVLSGLKNLRKLSLARGTVKDAALSHLKGLDKLESLNLFQTEVGDAGLDHLAGCKGLRRLYVFQSKVTDAGVDKLKASLPGLRVEKAAVLTVPPPPEPKKDEPKKDEPKKPEPKKDEPKKDEPKKDEPKKDEPKKDEPKKDEPKKDEPRKA